MSGPAKWPSRYPVWTLGALGVAALFFCALLWLQYAREWSEAERIYLVDYLRSGIRGGLSAGAQRRYLLLNGVTAKGEARLVLGDEVERVQDAEGKPGYRLTGEGLQRGLMHLEWHSAVYSDQGLHGVLRHWIYRDGNLWSYVGAPLYWALALFFLGLFATVPKDRARRSILKDGRRLSGPEMVRTAEFNERLGRHKGLMFYLPDGLALPNENRSWAERKFNDSSSRLVRLPCEREAMHFLIAGDNGAGKSAVMRQILCHVQERDEAAIVYDPAMEYLAQFYRPERGDVVLNPLDGRCPFWTPSDEVPHEAEALTIAASLFPETGRESHLAARRIFAHLVNFKVSPGVLADWMSSAEEIEHRLRGTEMQTMMGAHAGGQRAGILSVLKATAEAFRLLPKEAETERRWSTVEWSKMRKGWIFLTSKATTREQVLPLVSLWLDLLALRVMNEGAGTGRKTWFVLDELGSLQHLPQLAAAITERRRSQHPVVLGVPNKSQMEAVYGKATEALLSQPATRILFNTSDPKTAEWISKAIGEVEKERLRERPKGDFFYPKNGRNQHGEITHESLVTVAEIGGLDPLEGYLQHGNLVVRMRFPRLELQEQAERFVERKRSFGSTSPRQQAGREPERQHPQQASAGHPYFE